jgi:hypothetical protein
MNIAGVLARIKLDHRSITNTVCSVWVIPDADGKGGAQRDGRQSKVLRWSACLGHPTSLREVRGCVQAGHAALDGRDGVGVGEGSSHPGDVNEKGRGMERVVRQQARVDTLDRVGADPVKGSHDKHLCGGEGAPVQANLVQPAIPSGIPSVLTDEDIRKENVGHIQRSSDRQGGAG